VLPIEVCGEDKKSIKSRRDVGLQEVFYMEYVLKVNKQYLELLEQNV
jgi:hypothetical protein